jgi:hypothetical protein
MDFAEADITQEPRSFAAERCERAVEAGFEDQEIVAASNRGIGGATIVDAP